LAKINFVNLSYNPSPGAVEHRMRVFESTATPTPSEVYDAPFATVGVDGVIDQAEIEGFGAGIEGTFDLYLTGVDAVGNESDFAVKEDYPLDLVAPPAPTWN